MAGQKKLLILCATCGGGKSTVCTYLNEHRFLPGCACMDTDEVGINWWDHADSADPLALP